MRRDKQEAFELRKSGQSYNAINAVLQVPRATLSDWFSEIRWSQHLKNELAKKAWAVNRLKFLRMADANRARWAKWRESAKREGTLIFKKQNKDRFFCAGVMIYWGEGDKKPKTPVRVSNTDYRMLKIFVEFLKKYGKVEANKIKAHAILYPDLDETTCRGYWSKKIRVSVRNFYKSQYIVGRGNGKKLSHGICVVTVSSRQLKIKLLQWIELYAKEFNAGMV